MYTRYHIFIKSAADSQQGFKQRVRQNTKEYTEALFHSKALIFHVMDKQMQGAMMHAYYEIFHIPPDG
jgi:hypothetical protein